jgi:tetratricopeptide (TPR) repeat protein
VYNIAECYVLKQDKKKAIEEYLKLKKMSPKSNTWRLTGLAKLGEIYEEDEEWTKAIRIYEDIVRNTTNEEWRKIVAERIRLIREALR